MVCLINKNDVIHFPKKCPTPLTVWHDETIRIEMTEKNFFAIYLPNQRPEISIIKKIIGGTRIDQQYVWLECQQLLMIVAEPILQSMKASGAKKSPGRSLQASSQKRLALVGPNDLMIRSHHDLMPLFQSPGRKV